MSGAPTHFYGTIGFDPQPFGQGVPSKLGYLMKVENAPSIQ